VGVTGKKGEREKQRRGENGATGRRDQLVLISLLEINTPEGTKGGRNNGRRGKTFE